MNPQLSKKQNAWWILAFALTGLSWWTYVGPYRWITELQIRLFDGYFVQLSALFTLLLIGVPGALLIGKIERRQDAAASAPARALDPAWLLALPAASLLVGGALRLQAGGMRLERTTASAIEWGQEPRTRWIEVEGRVLADTSVCASDGVRECYVPFVSPEWTPVIPVAVFLHTRSAPSSLAAPRYQGVASLSKLPGPVLAAYQRAELGPAKKFVVLDVDASPQDVHEQAMIFLVAGGLALPVIAAAVFFHHRRARLVAELVARSRAAAAALPRAES